MTFDTEPQWMKEARKAPLRSTWESRQPGFIPHPGNPLQGEYNDDREAIEE